jgi:hypothetical protein
LFPKITFEPEFEVTVAPEPETLNPAKSKVPEIVKEEFNIVLPSIIISLNKVISFCNIVFPDIFNEDKIVVFPCSIAIPDTTCGQWLWESVPNHVIGDQTFIVVDGAEDNSSYNDIIKPFKGL